MYDDYRSIARVVWIVLAVLEVGVIALGILVGACRHDIAMIALGFLQFVVSINFLAEVINRLTGLFGRWLDLFDSYIELRGKYVWIGLGILLFQFLLGMTGHENCYSMLG